jgi:NAD dependent epimerase/dehydratase family enzyme
LATARRQINTEPFAERKVKAVRIVITGATGFIGSHLVRRLLAGGHAVVALRRNVESARRLLPVRCECRAWDPGAGPEAPLLRGAGAIVHLAGEGIFVLRWALGEMSTVLLASQRVLPRAAQRLRFEFRYPEIGPALADLCFAHDHQL